MGSLQNNQNNSITASKGTALETSGGKCPEGVYDLQRILWGDLKGKKKRERLALGLSFAPKGSWLRAHSTPASDRGRALLLT